MIATTESYESPAAGLRLCRHLFRPDGAEAPKGRVILLEGLGDHIGCHKVAAELFCARGFVCGGLDWPGHGLSEGKRGHIAGVSLAGRLIVETVAWLDEMAECDGRRILYAHSTGAFFALHHLGGRETRQGTVADPTRFDRVWLSSPLIRPEFGQPSLLVWAAPWLARMAPTLILDSKVRPERCRHIDPGAPPDPEEALCHHWVSAGLGADLLGHASATPRTAFALRDPMSVLLTQGAEDPICPPSFSKAFFDTIPTSRKTYALLPGTRHEALREPDNSPVRDAANRWLDEGD